MDRKNDKIEKRLDLLKKDVAKKTAEAEQLQSKHKKRRSELEAAQKNKWLNMMHPASLKQSIRTIGAYALGRRNRKQLYSKTYKAKQASNDLKPYVRLLYNEGFNEKALTDLITLHQTTTNKYTKRSTAWELALYYANKESQYFAEEALHYMKLAKKHVKDSITLRQMTLVEVECLLRLTEHEQAQALLQQLLITDKHPDILLARANIESDIDKKLAMINQVYRQFNLQPIYFNFTEDVSYDDLQTANEAETILNETKISVILPAYNCEVGIRTAIESMLAQTWQNFELLIVDDCSTDGTFKVAKQYEANDERIKVLQTPTNSGPYIARNIALREATGTFVTVNDADDWSHAEKLAIQASHLIEHPEVIANTSELSRLTENLQFYRRGTRGRYLFSNMSSLMFRREVVLEKIGYWDNVRFAADGEYKRRMILAFGQDAVVDLKTGPLSLPRQTETSLTGSSAFGYNGYFTGVRREYVASFTHYHQENKLYYPERQTERLFPVPTPMLPDRPNPKAYREVDVVFIADFYQLSTTGKKLLLEDIETNKQLGFTTGLVQLTTYDISKQKQFDRDIRNKIDGQQLQMLVYGEHIQTNIVIVRTPKVLQYWQQFIPKIKTLSTLVMIDELPVMKYNSKLVQQYKMRPCVRQIMQYFNKRGRWYPLDGSIRNTLEKHFAHEIRAVHYAKEDWLDDKGHNQYEKIIQDWMI